MSSKTITPKRHSKAEKEAMALLAACAAKRLKVTSDYEFKVIIKLYKPGSLGR